ncbi:MAG TPA: tetratricopeptide repeat protein [Longimicrobium sp.]|nr:tetratricopeptide repeat protein [Longimicrobium sp.]
MRAVSGKIRAPVASRAPRPHALERWERELNQRTGDPFWAPAVTILAELGAGESADVRQVAHASMAACEWLLGAAAWQSALLFAEAAALAWPSNPRLAWVTGRMLRKYGRMREAELWLRRSARIAVWNGDAETQDLALNSLGNLFAQQGCFGAAKLYLHRALRIAERVSKARRGAVTHDLFALAVMTGDHARAEELAIRAFNLYGDAHPKLPRLAHDVAQLWMRQGRFSLAVPVYEALLRHVTSRAERLQVLASSVRAAGACRSASAYERAWKRVWKQMDGGADLAAVLPGALVDVGIGAAGMGEWTHASNALNAAIHAARAIGAHEDAAQAEAALESVNSHQRTESPRGTIHPQHKTCVRRGWTAAPRSGSRSHSANSATRHRRRWRWGFVEHRIGLRAARFDGGCGCLRAAGDEHGCNGGGNDSRGPHVEPPICIEDEGM